MRISSHAKSRNNKIILNDKFVIEARHFRFAGNGSRAYVGVRISLASCSRLVRKSGSNELGLGAMIQVL